MLLACVGVLVGGMVAAGGSTPVGAQTTPGGVGSEAALVYTAVAPAIVGCESSNTLVSTAGGSFVPARFVNVAPSTWAGEVWLAAEPGVSLGNAAPELPCGYARYDGQSPDVQRIPQPVQRYVYRIDVGSYSAAATRFALEISLRADNVAKVRVNGQLIGQTPACDADGEDLAAPIDCPLSAFQGPMTTFIVPEVALTTQRTPLVEIEVLDYGSYTGLSYIIRRGESSSPPPSVSPCAPSSNASCSLTVTVPVGVPAGTARYCYAPPDDEARELTIPTASGNVTVTMPAGTWVDAPASATGTIYYPNEFWPVQVSEIADPALSRCPGAIPT
ncbi:MAG: hypothetical protein R2749_08755 [Acidimicrobiales bacterium]